MKLFDVYPLYDINIVKGQGCKVWDENGTEYLDLYGGHAVISIGHAHPHYVEMISNQVATLGFYSNSVINKLQQQVAERLGKISGYEDYSLFLINSGAEANENALKLASFYNGRTKVISFSKAFHGRTSLAVEATNNPTIIAPINNNGHVTYLPLNAIEAMGKNPPERSRTLIISIEKGTPINTHSRYLIISFEDSGKGIEQKNIENVFNPFFTTKEEGTGLGLAICYGIINRHEGEIEVKSVPDKGTCINIKLPQRI